MAIKPFNSVGGYSVGPNLEIAIDSERSANLVNVTVNGNLTLVGDDIQLGDVANVHIDGGSNGQYLATDGTGNLTWVTLDTDTLANGTSNVSIDSVNGNITFGVNGTANVVTISDAGLDISGASSANLEFGSAANVFTSGTDSIDIFTNNKTGAYSEVALNHGSNVLIVADGNGWAFNADGSTQFPGFTLDSATTPTTAQVLTFNGTTATWATVDTDTLANGTSNVSIDSVNGPVTIGVNGNANVAVFTDVSANFSGSIYATNGQVNAYALYATTSANVDSLDVRSNAAIVGVANVTGNINGDSNLNLLGDANIVSDLLVGGAANVTGTANIASAVDLGSTLDVVGIATFDANVDITGNLTFAGASGANVDATYGVTTANLTANGLVTLGSNANVKITGGTANLVLTTDGAGNLSWTNQSLKYSREIHVDSTLGNDTTGDGSYNKPYATIMKAHAVVTSGFTVFLHVGGYSEDVTWTKTNCDIIGLSEGGMVNCTGNWTVGTSAGASVRIKDIAINGTFTQNGAGRVLFKSSYLRSTFTKTSGEYTQFDDCDAAGTGISIASAGTVVFNGGSQNIISVSNAGAVVSINNTIATASITVTAGTVVASDSYIYALTNTGNAVTSSAGTAVYLYNSHCIAPNQTIARISMGGFWTANDTQYDKANSTLTGTNLGTISHFDALNTYGAANVGTLTVRGTSSLGAVGNVSITGGTTGQYLQTDGSGALSWTTVELSNIHNGTSNVNIATTDGDVTIASNGQGNIVTIASDGLFATTTINDDVIITGNLTVHGNTVSVNVTELNIEDPIITEGRGANGAVLTAPDGKDRGLFSYYFDTTEKGAFAGYMTTGSDAGQYVIATDAIVVDNVVTVNTYGNVVVGNVIGNLAKGTTSVGIAGANGAITMSVNGTANVVVADATGIDVTGAVKVRTVTSIDAATLTTTDTTPTVIAEVDYADGLAVEFLVKGRDTIAAVSEVNTVLSICEGGGADHTIYGTVNSGATAGSFTVGVNAGKLQLIATAASANATTWTVQFRTI